jgi:hypothetical protein
MHDPLERSAMRAGLNVLRIVAVVVFLVVWSVQMYLSFFGPSRASPATGAIYPVTIHGGVTYATSWQRYLASQGALALSILLVALNILLRRLYLPTRGVLIRGACCFTSMQIGVSPLS